MAEKMASTEEERGVDNRKEVEEEVVTEEMEKELEEAESLDNLPVFERQSKGRATVCLGDMKPRCSLCNDDGAFQEEKSVDSRDDDDTIVRVADGDRKESSHEGSQVLVGRSQSLRRPFKRIGDGLAKTLRQLKKK